MTPKQFAIKVNSTIIDTSIIKEFGYDGCHKIYLVTSERGKKELEEYEYDFLPIEQLKETYEASCHLRFIYSADLGIKFATQDTAAVIKEL